MLNEKEVRRLLEVIRKNKEYAVKHGFHYEAYIYKILEALVKFILGERHSPWYHDFIVEAEEK